MTRTRGPAEMQVTQKAIIVNDARRIVMVQYGAAGEHDWDLPGGRVEAGETDLDLALAREVKEETGLVATVGRTLAAYVAAHYATGQPTLFLFRQVVLAVGELTSAGQVPEDDIARVAWLPLAEVSGLPLNPCVGPHLQDVLRRHWGVRPAGQC